MRRTGTNQVVPNQRIKKKNLRASESEAFLKIIGFHGKFGESSTTSETVSNSATSKPGTKKTIDTSRQRPDSSFKIKDSLRQVSQSQPVTVVKPLVEQQAKVEAREPLDETKVISALERYVAEHRPEPTVAIALKTHKPLVEQEKITILVDNQLQLDKLEAMKMHFQQSLMKSLNNGYVACEFKLFDSGIAKEEKKLFTASEKFEHFVSINPVVADLKNIFGLEID